MLAIAVAITLALYAIWWFMTVMWYGHASKIESFGGPFEGISALFAGLGCAGIAVTLWYQTKQLKAQQADSEETKKVLTDQVTALNAQARAINAQVEALTRPYMTARVYLQHDTTRILLIENHGKSPALNLKMRLMQPFMIHRENEARTINLQNVRAFSDVIKTFVPGTKLEYYLIRGEELHSPTRKDSVVPTVFQIEMQYEGSPDHCYTESIEIHLMDHEATIVNTEFIRRELDDIGKNLSTLTDVQKELVRAVKDHRPQ